jgi:DNA-binding transcriptional regulator YiaG
MSTKSELREKFGPQVRIRDIARVPSGSPARYVLKADTPFHRTVPAAEALAKRGLTLLQAKRIVTRLTNGESVAVEMPMVEDQEIFKQELLGFGVMAEGRDPPVEVNVKEIRERLGLSQDEFAMRFGFDAASLRNWEQQRTVPELAVRSFFRVIETNPSAVERALGKYSDVGQTNR